VPKGIFTQGMMVLLSESVSLDKLEQVLAEEFNIVGKNENFQEWSFCGPSLLISFRPEVNGYVLVDIVDKPWPDHMGDPEQKDMLFNAWSAGNFGPFAFPGNLNHAAQQSWLFEEGPNVAKEHKGFIRIRSSYVVANAQEGTPYMPEDYNVKDEIIFVTKIAQKILQLHQTIGFFNPNGECLASDELVDNLMARYDQAGYIPLEIWTNVRVFNVPENKDWLLMDTVGMAQLDSVDHEAIFLRDSYDPSEVVVFLRNLSVYLLKKPELDEDEALTGPGNVEWKSSVKKMSKSSPPRTVIRWYPLDNSTPPEEV